MLETIKQDIETYIKENITDVAVKWENTNLCTLNNIRLSQAEINNLDTYISPFLVPVDSSRDLISSLTPIKHIAYMQLNVYIRKERGTIGTYDLIARLDNLFREIRINDTQTLAVQVSPKFSIDDFEVIPVQVDCYNRS